MCLNINPAFIKRFLKLYIAVEIWKKIFKLLKEKKIYFCQNVKSISVRSVQFCFNNRVIKKHCKLIIYSWILVHYIAQNKNQKQQENASCFGETKHFLHWSMKAFTKPDFQPVFSAESFRQIERNVIFLL